MELIPAAAYREPILRHGGRANWIALMDPDAVQHVLIRHETHPKSRMLLRPVQPRRGGNLAVTEGQGWRRQRKALAPAFTRQALAPTGAR
ncbi:cytochrome P450 [Rhodovulum iodosum]|uniref:Cytochrome P450 n=1 Tax=Rhodovulum iodosum TaxID=68291 RepID=A0ABV3XYL5_9RHOB|nr:cytochrome P450 [Rhodovulum robiginosum]